MISIGLIAQVLIAYRMYGDLGCSCADADIINVVIHLSSKAVANLNNANVGSYDTSMGLH
jgi:hypothetical protein